MVSLSRLSVQFSAGTSGGVPPYKYTWSFGDGGSDTTGSPVHTYQAQGSYQVSLVVTDAVGQSASGTLAVQIAFPYLSAQTLRIKSPGPPVIAIYTDMYYPGTGIANFFSSSTGEIDISCQVDGNYLVLTGPLLQVSYPNAVYDDTGVLIDYGPPAYSTVPQTLAMNPGGYNAQSKITGPYWGGTFQGIMVDASIFQGGGWPTAGFSAFPSWLQQNYPGAYLGSMNFQMPKPTMQIIDLGYDYSVSNWATFHVHKIEVVYVDDMGNYLSAVVHQIAAIGLPGATIGMVTIQPGGVGYFDVSLGGSGNPPLSVMAEVGGIWSGGAPYTQNSVVSNVLTLSPS